MLLIISNTSKKVRHNDGHTAFLMCCIGSERKTYPAYSKHLGGTKRNLLHLATTKTLNLEQILKFITPDEQVTI